MAKKIGRPTSYTPKIGAEICERYAAGASMVKICEDKRMPCYTTVMNWKREERGNFLAIYTQAREDRAWTWFEEMTDIADKATPENVQVARLRVGTRQWSLARLLSRIFGDRPALEGGDPDRPIRIVDKSELALAITNLLGASVRRQKAEKAKGPKPKA